MNIPLLTTKFYVPPQYPNLVSRPLLMAQLDQALHLSKRLTLVAAKAGSGKTTLVSSWVHQQNHSVAWLSLDTNDNDPRRFFSYLIAALHQSGVEFTSSLLSQLEMPQLPQFDALIAEIINAVVLCETPLLLVLDDYHLIQDAGIHRAISFLVEYHPPEMHLILITRVDPPFPLSRLRGQGLITEIRDQNLRFTDDEALCFINDIMALNLPLTAVATLEHRIEGWIVGLQMAALALQARQKQDSDIDAFVEGFGGTHRFILDYLMEEVMNQQSPAIQQFLIETAILERMCAPLCDAVRFEETNIDQHPMTSNDSQTVLVQLERAHLFVVALDGNRYWYRYHHLFADLLKRILRQRHSEAELRELYRRASQWHQSEGFLEEAMMYTMEARNYEQAASLIEENIVNMFLRSEVPVLLRWIEQLPVQLVRSRPWIDVYRANTLALTGQLDEVDTLLDDVEARLAQKSQQVPELLGHIAAVRAYSANLRGDAGRVYEMAALTQTYLPEEHLTARGMATYALADTYFAADDMPHASRALREMLEVGENTGQLMLIITALCELATVDKVLGKLSQAEKRYMQARQWMAAHGALDSRVRCAYEFGLADLLYERNQLDAAYDHAMTGIEFRQRLGGYWVVGDLPLIRILQARNDAEAALRVLYEVEQIVQTHHFQMTGVIAFNTARIVQWLAVGDVKTASDWGYTCSGDSELERITLARLRLAQDRVSDAFQLLEQQLVLAEAGKRTGRLIEILNLKALVLSAMKQQNKAESLLSQSLNLARPEGYVRAFLELGSPMCRLLEHLVMQQTSTNSEESTELNNIITAYAHSLLDAFRQEGLVKHQQAVKLSTPSLLPSGTLLDSLTDREAEVLRLLAEGLSNKEIAARLIVAPSTIKQHLKNIYSKLDVHNRTQAVARGQELALL